MFSAVYVYKSRGDKVDYSFRGTFPFWEKKLTLEATVCVSTYLVLDCIAHLLNKCQTTMSPLPRQEATNPHEKAILDLHQTVHKNCLVQPEKIKPFRRIKWWLRGTRPERI